MTIVTDVIAAEIATLTRLVQAPQAPLGFGQDLDCATDIDPYLLEVDPSSKTALAQALIRRLSCPRGRLPDDDSYGFDLRGMLNKGTSADVLRDIAGQTKGEVIKDDRVRDAQVTASYAPQTEAMNVTVDVSAVDPSVGEFSLTLALTNGGELLAEING